MFLREVQPNPNLYWNGSQAGSSNGATWICIISGCGANLSSLGLLQAAEEWG